MHSAGSRIQMPALQCLCAWTHTHTDNSASAASIGVPALCQASHAHTAWHRQVSQSRASHSLQSYACTVSLDQSASRLLTGEAWRKPGRHRYLLWAGVYQRLDLRDGEIQLAICPHCAKQVMHTAHGTR